MGLDTTDEWISERTGISSRHLLPEGMGLKDLASTAATRALEGTGVSPEEVWHHMLARARPVEGGSAGGGAAGRSGWVREGATLELAPALPTLACAPAHNTADASAANADTATATPTPTGNGNGNG